MKHVLLVAYEYPGYHSKSGAALARRVKQVAESFAGEGWQVTVIHKDQIGETGKSACVVKQETASITRMSVKTERHEFTFLERFAFRKLFTLYYLLQKGDRSYKWADSVIKKWQTSQPVLPDLVISFFTPRGPISVGRFFAKKYNIPWIADLQDELDQGLLSSNRYFSALNSGLSHIWVRKALSSAKAVVQVSPEWAKIDSAILGRSVACIRHAITASQMEIYNSDTNSEFRIFYGGSIELPSQELETLNEVLLNVRASKPIKLVIAGNETSYLAFRNSLHKSIDIDYVGWLDAKAYNRTIRECHCCLIIPWSGTSRQVIPSKFYEVCAMRPVWVVGRDSGAFKSLLNDFAHPMAAHDDVDFNVSVIERAVAGDYSALFTLDKCRRVPVTDKELCNRYLALLHPLIDVSE